ncbi:MAG TPA: CvpA family protein [Bryobacteraceae bacterium]|nr:CvpA family protein [Bryobacteraceae bacterium]
MNWFDIVLLIIVGSSTVAGFLKGFVRVALGLVATVAAFLLSLGFYRMAGGWFTPVVDSPNTAKLLGFVTIFIGVLLLGWLAGILLSRLLRAVGLSWVDRLGGAVAGAARGIVFAIVILTIVVTFKSDPRFVAESQYAPYVVRASHVAVQFAPRELNDAFHSGYQRLRQAWSEVKKGVPKLPVERM